MTDPVHGQELRDPAIFNYGTSWGWGEPSHGEHFRRCTFCGSIHPDDLAVEPTWRAEWADRKRGYPHKFYVNVVNRDPDALFALGSSWGGTGDRTNWPKGSIAWDELSAEQKAIYERDHGPERDDRHPNCVQFSTKPKHHAKFYSAHLADPAISDATKDAIAEVSGLRFRFLDDGRIGWEPTHATS